MKQDGHSQRTIPIDLLKTFLFLSESQNFSRTAEYVGRSQSAVSLQMKKLQAIVGAPIFTSSGKSMALTQQGEILADYASSLVKLNDECVQRLDGALLQGKIRVGLPSDFATVFLPQVIRKFSSNHPDIEIEVRCDLSTILKNKIDDRNYDLVLALNDGPSSKHLVRLWHDPVCWVGARDAQFSKNHPLPLVLFPEGCQYRARVITALTRADKPFKVIYSSSDISANYAAIEEGLGLTAMCKSTIPSHLREAENAELLPPLEQIGIGLHWDSRGATATTSKLIDYLIGALDAELVCE